MCWIQLRMYLNVWLPEEISPIQTYSNASETIRQECKTTIQNRTIDKRQACQALLSKKYMSSMFDDQAQERHVTYNLLPMTLPGGMRGSD